VHSQRKKLSDILQQDSDRTRLQQAWDATTAAEDFAPLPAGEYSCRVLAGELFNAKQRGTPGYKLTFEVAEGEHAGRRVWHDLWLTAQALPMTKRDLAKLGVTSVEQLERPLPGGILAKVKVALRRDDDGGEHNKVRTFEAVGVEPPDPFAPADAPTEEPPCPFDDGKPPSGTNDEGEGSVGTSPPCEGAEAVAPGRNGRALAASPLFDGEAPAGGPYGGDRM
jgi:hypothetical protein